MQDLSRPGRQPDTSLKVQYIVLQSWGLHLAIGILGIGVAASQNYSHKQRLHADCHRLELARLQLAALVAVKGEGSQALPGHCLASPRRPNVQLHLAGNLHRRPKLKSCADRILLWKLQDMCVETRRSRIVFWHYTAATEGPCGCKVTCTEMLFQVLIAT